MACAHNTFGRQCGVWGVDWLSRQGYKVSVIMALCEDWQCAWGNTARPPRQYGLSRAQ